MGLGIGEILQDGGRAAVGITGQRASGDWVGSLGVLVKCKEGMVTGGCFSELPGSVNL